ncbi:helix-turn-helix domain-containing protein [Streptomyces sp. NPDC006458]|uniref:PucR family transcriptional regulator n=1 Tax=Streptomyces sp. NPDC006458 TaxID=3154302 RepID=UPI0033BB0F89
MALVPECVQSLRDDGVVCWPLTEPESIDLITGRRAHGGTPAAQEAASAVGECVRGLKRDRRPTGWRPTPLVSWPGAPTHRRSRPPAVTAGRPERALGAGVPSGTTLREVLAQDEDGVLRLLLAPAGQDDVVVKGVIIGVEDAAGPYDGHLVLAVGARPDDVSAPDVVREAARRGAVAVVLRDGGEDGVPGPVLDAARRAGIALLSRAEWAEWGDTLELVRFALALGAVGSQDSLAQGAAGGGLGMLAAVVARYCRASITVEDTQFRVLAHSATSADADGLRLSTILGGRVPEWRVAELRRSGLLRTLWTSRDVIHRPADENDPERLIVAIRSGGEVLGSIWAAADGDRLSPDAAQALRRAAEVAVPYLLQHRLRGSTSRRRQAHALRGLLLGEGDHDSHMWSLELSPDMPCAVVVAERDRASGPTAERSLQALALQAAAYRPTARVWRESDRLTVLLPVPDADERDAPNLARELASLAAAMPDAPAVWVGAGAPATAPSGAADSYDEALLIVRALREREARAAGPGHSGPIHLRPGHSGPGHSGPGHFGAAPAAADRHEPLRHAGPGDLTSTVAVLRVLDAIRPLWERHGGPVHDMIAADLAAGGDLVRSLTAYLDAAGDMSRAARRLVLHPNTLRYRLRRVRERFGIDLDDPDTRLVVTLAVRLAETGPPHREGRERF